MLCMGVLIEQFAIRPIRPRPRATPKKVGRIIFPAGSISGARGRAARLLYQPATTVHVPPWQQDSLGNHPATARQPVSTDVMATGQPPI
jgi:hypothetical protein